MKPSPLRLFGKHACYAALENPMRKITRILVTKQAQAELGARARAFALAVVDGKKLDELLPPGASHQGIAVECAPLAQPLLSDWLGEGLAKPVLLLDQVTDPHNVGAILRSGAAFDVGCVIVTDRNAPQESGVMAKSASGAMEITPLISVVNLSQAMEELKKAGYWIYGLDGAAKDSIAHAKFDAKSALVLGAEGAGLRRLTTERCDFLVKLPISPKMESLNVSNAAAVALYEVYRSRK